MERARKLEASLALAAIVAIGASMLLDEGVARALASFPDAWVRPATWVLTALGPIPMLLLIGVAGFALDRAGKRQPYQVDAATAMFGAAVGAGASALILKHLFGRAAPSLVDIVGPFHFDLLVVDADFASFPDIEVAVLTAAAVSAWRSGYRAAAAVAGVAALTVAVAQGGLRAAYLSDAVAGVVIGCGWAIFVYRILSRRAERRRL